VSLAARAALGILRLAIDFFLKTTPQNPDLRASGLDLGNPCLTRSPPPFCDLYRHIIADLDS
jgi:hypothetical protein